MGQDGVDHHLVKTIRDLRDLMNQILRQKVQLQELDRHDKIFRNLLRYMRLHLTRLARYPSMPIDYIALSSRNLIEASLWAEFLMADQENIDWFGFERMIDLKELKRTYGVISQNSSTQNSLKHTDLRKIRTDDKFWHKLCSKIIHPTSLSINTSLQPMSQAALEQKANFARYGLECAMRGLTTITRIPNGFGSNDDIEAS